MSTVEIPLVGVKAAGRVTVLEEAGYELVSQYRWRVWEKTRPGGRTWGPYAVTRLLVLPNGASGSPSLGMHSLLTGWALVDHVNGDGLDNRRELNLRPATDAQNSQNRQSWLGSTSQFKGVCWNQARRRWQAAIKVSGKSQHLGLFIDEEEAARTYDEAAREAYGEFAYLNFRGVA